MINERKINETLETLEYMVPKMAVLRKRMLDCLVNEGFTRSEAMEIIKHSAGSNQ